MSDTLPFNIRQDVDLTQHNTLRLPCVARFFCHLDDEAMLPSVLNFAQSKRLPVVLLGQGSNIVLPERLDALVLTVACQAITLLNNECTDDLGRFVTVRVGAGHDWHAWVTHCVRECWYGLENLALIPGTVGAAPIQNIGAYGREVSEFIVGVHAVDLIDGSEKYLSADDCAFAYRDSVFKHYPDRWLITRVDFCLPLDDQPELSYTALREKCLQDCARPNAKAVYDAVVAIRRDKLPDPVTLPNAGSFFKNPIVAESQYQVLLNDWAELPAMPVPEQGFVKLPAAWLIDSLGWRGRQLGPVGMHVSQALVMVNYGGASQSDVLTLARQIQAEVEERFGVSLEIEPRVDWPLWV